MWPVILRELRAGSRRWTTYWLRLLAAGAVLAAIAWWLEQPRFALVKPARAGFEIFKLLHAVVMAAIWIIVPMLTADTLSREKREGTLGLLFLTNLSARAIVFAKGAAALLLALTLWLSVVPIMTVPVLMGGVPAQEIIFSCSVALGSICMALAAGLMASVLSQRGTGAVALAFTLSVAGHLIFCVVVSLCINEIWVKNPPPAGVNYGLLAPVGIGTYMIWNLPSTLRGVGFALAPKGSFWQMAALIPLLSFLLAMFASSLCAVILRRTWQDKPKSKARTDTEKFLCSPVVLAGTFRAWMRRSLERNPVGWLEKRRVAGRIMAWVWLAIMASFASTLTYGGGGLRPGDFNPLMWMLLITIAYVAAGSFRRERETGALELLLVTPLSERQIIHGRLRGLWEQFLPTFALWVMVVIYIGTAGRRWNPGDVIEFTAAYLAVPVVGLYFSLRFRITVLSWLATLAVCFAVPQVLGQGVDWVVEMFSQFFFAHSPSHFSTSLANASVQLTLGFFLLWRLRVNLVRRSFSLR